MKIVKAAKGTPQELEMLVESRIDELENGDISESTDIESSRGDRGQLYVDMDGSITGLGETIGIFELRDLYDKLYDDDPVVNAYDSFESWLRDTVNNGYLKPIRSSFVYPEDLEDLENGEYESHVTEPINASAIVRPVGHHSWAVYLPDGHDHAEKLFESESEDECYDWINDNQRIIWEKEFNMNGDSIEGAAGSPQELQMLVENRLDSLESGVDASFVYPEDLVDLENGEYESHLTEPVNASIEPVQAVTFKSIELDDDELEMLDEIANRYVSSVPLSGDWDTETEHEQRAIADAFGVDMNLAKWIMIQYLGFEDDDFTSTAVESAEGVPGIDFDDEYEETFEERYKPTAEAISDWLGEHDQAYEDVCNFFGCSVEEDVADYADADQLIDWISEHEWLSEDFSNYFGYEWIEGCTNTANIMSAIDMTTPVEPDMLPAYIANMEGRLYNLFTNRYTCIRDVEVRYMGKNNGVFVTIKFEPSTGEDDMHNSYAAAFLPKDSEAAAYKIYAETVEDWGEELADTERIFEETL